MTFSSERHEAIFTVYIYSDFILDLGEYFFLDLHIPTAAAAYVVIPRGHLMQP